jgi:glycerol-3-phosphate O-acyltransferase/dihydroxyacetone phosphate acyltransferase
LINALHNWAQKDEGVKELQLNLDEYRKSLNSLKLRDQHIAKYDEETITAISTIADLIKMSLLSLIDLPLFLPGLIAHLPLYIAGYYAGKTEIYMEVRAQNKIFLGMALALFTYVFVFFWSWFTLFGASFWGLFVAIGVTFTFMWYHVVSIDDRYDSWKDLLGRWRLFDAFVMGRGMWKRRDRIQECKKLRRTCQRGLQSLILEHHAEDNDLEYIWLSVRSRAKEFAYVSSQPKGRRMTSQMKRARSYKWAMEE